MWQLCRCPCKIGKRRSAICKGWQIVKYPKPNAGCPVPTLRASATACCPKKGKPTPPCPDLRPVRRAKIFVWPIRAPMAASAPPARNAYRLLQHHRFLLSTPHSPYLVPIPTSEAEGTDLAVIQSKGARASSLSLVRINCNVPGLGVTPRLRA